MRLSSLLARAAVLPQGSVAADPEIRGVRVDSRRVRPGELFAALRGTRSDGSIFVTDALKRGAAGTENTMPLIVECVKAYCTVGEISDALRDVYGTWDEPAVF